MNICLITGIFPPDIGGPATYISRLAYALFQENHDVIVITLGDEKLDVPFPVQRISRRFPLPLRIFLVFLTLLRHGWHSDVWYINGLELPAVLAGKLLRKRLVMKIVGDYAWERSMNRGLTWDSIDDFQQRSQQSHVEFHKRLRTWLARQVEQVITPSRYLKTLVAGWGVPPERIQVIYNAIEPLPQDLRTNAEIRQELEMSQDDQIIITVGRLVKWKGVESLIQLLPRFENSVKLLIVGDGPEKNKLTEFTEHLNLTRRVKFTGALPRKRVLELLQAADMFVLNTGYEGFSHILLEAMMTGTPVITTSVCGNPELVQHQKNGFLVNPSDSIELFQAVASLLNNRTRQEQYIIQGQQTVRQFSWERLLRETTQILDHSIKNYARIDDKL